MKQFTEIIPLLLFFITWKITPHPVEIAGITYTLGGIFSATQILLASCIITYTFIFIKNKRLERSQVISLIAICVFGSFTLYFHEEAILKWKAPVVNWIFALVYAVNLFVGDKTISERLLHQAFDMPALQWKKLDIAWIIFFTFLGAANLYVAFTYPEHWVTFKVFGSLGFTFAFIGGQFYVLRKHLKLSENPSEEEQH
jgi:intracellular septation protein